MKTHPKRASPSVLVLGALLACTVPATGLDAQNLTLTAAIDSALATHPTIRGVQARIQQVAEGTSATRATRWPSVGLDMSLTHFQDPMLVQPIHSFNPTDLPRFDETLLQGRLGARYTLFGDGRGARIDGAEATLEEARAQGRVTEEALIESVTAAYLGVLSSRAVLESATARVTSLAEEEARARRAFAAGTAAEVEILRAAAATQDARAQQTTAAASATLAERGLARLMGRPAAGLLGAAMVDVAVIEQPDPRGIADDARVVRAERSVLASEARLSEHRSEWYPRFDLTAGLLDFASLEGSHVFEWQAGIQMSWAVFSGGARRSSIRGAQAELLSAESELAAMRLQVDQETDEARSAIEAADARRDAFAVSVRQWEELARIERLSVEAGTGVQSDLLRAEAGLFQARAAYTNARYEAVLARVRLARTQGVLDRTWLNEALETSG